jgi:OmcA/MtrC family decaheme c-type cytochrome
MTKRPIILFIALCMAAPLMFYGCGSDGSAGAPGAPGATGGTGPAGQDVTANPQPESCDVCHGVGKIREVRTVHAITGVASATVVGTPVADGTGNLVVTLNAKIDGVNIDAFTLRRVYVNIDNAAQLTGTETVPVLTTFQRIQLNVDNVANPAFVAFASTGSGNYTATVPVAFVFDNATYLFQLQAAAVTTERPVAVVANGTRLLRDLVTNTGCASCHGPYPAWSKNFSHYPVGGSECQVCHTQYGRTMEARTLNAGGTIDNLTTAIGTNLPEYIHGIHNSHNMPGGQYFRSNPGGHEPGDLNVEERYSVGYPSDMKNCNVCHETPAQQATIAAAPVSYFLCMSCHQTWDGFVRAHDDPATTANETGTPVFAANNFHRGSTPATNCMSCHAAITTIDEASDFHNLFEAADSHLDSFYRGEDISFNNPDNVLFNLTGITKSNDNVAFTWTATKGGAAVNPCNDNLSTGPTFRSLGAYLAYAKGDDWVNEDISATQAPGQPLGARNLFTDLSTTCASNVATTTGLVVAQGPKAYAKKALIAIGGKPLNRGTFTVAAASVAKDYFVRVPSPTRAFSMIDNSIPAPRRNAVESEKCHSCHRGTMYQHGGDRVDNEQMCVICHNPSASEKNVRANRGSGNSGGYAILNPDNTVNTSKTYDGKPAETFDLRYLLHAVHGAEKREKPIVIYRNRGIFAFAPPLYETRPDPVDGDPERISVEHPRPTGWVDGSSPVFGSLENDNQAHTWTTIHYPKPANDCFACHNDDATQFSAPVDQTKAVALTVDPGTSFNLQNDDLVIGPTAAPPATNRREPPVYRSNGTQPSTSATRRS